MFVFILAALLGYVGYLVINNFISKDKDLFSKIINDSVVLISFIISSLFFTWFFTKNNIFAVSYNGIFASISGIAGIGSNIWPNVLSSVAELNPASFGQIVNSVGGK